MPLNPGSFAVAKFAPDGFMDMDSDPWNVDTAHGNYTNSLNVTLIGLQGGTTRYATSVLGNTYAFTPFNVAAQNKGYLITIEEPTGNNYSFHFTNINGSDFPTPITVNFTTTGNLATDTTSLVNLFVSDLTAYGCVANSVVSGQIRVLLDNAGFYGFDYLIQDIGTSKGNPIIFQEAIDSSLIGLTIPTGSADVNGSLFFIGSPVGKDPIKYNIIGTTNSSGSVAITLSGDQTGSILYDYSVSVQGVNGTTEANGEWLTNSVTYDGTNTHVVLFNSSYSNAYTSGGSLTIFYSGFIDISVHTYTPLTQAWASTNLLRTKQINGRYIHPERNVDADVANDITSLYFTDKNDVPRIFQYTGSYVNDGAIEYFNPNGLYTYEGLNLATNLQETNATPIITQINVLSAGGGVANGLWRYAVTLSDSNGNSTLPSLLSAPAQITNYSPAAPSQYFGSTSGTASNKQVQLTISDIPIGAFTFLTLIGVNYVQGAEVAYTIKTVSIPQGVTTLNVTHTGLETYSNYDTSLLTENAVTYLTAGSLAISSNTLLMADLTSQKISDFSAWAQTFTHAIHKDTTSLLPIGDDFVGYTLGQYQQSEATFANIGYMDNETYRMGVCIELLSGEKTPIFWIDDIRMDNFHYETLSLNTVVGTFQVGDLLTGSFSGATGTVSQIIGGVLYVTPTSNSVFVGGGVDHITGSISGATAHVASNTTTWFNKANPNAGTPGSGVGGYRRTSSFSNYDLSATSNGGQSTLQNENAYVTYLTLSNIDFNYVVDGQPISSIAKRIYIFRVDNSTYGLNEVLSTGIINRHVYGSGGAVHGNDGNPAGSGTSTVAFDNPFVLTLNGVAGLPIFTNVNQVPQSTAFASTGYSYGAWGLTGTGSAIYADLYSCSFYSLDSIFNQTVLTYESGDALVCFGQPDFRTTYPNANPNVNETALSTCPALTSGNTVWQGIYLKMSGVTNQSIEPTHNSLSNTGQFENLPSYVGQVGWIPGNGGYGITSYTSGTYYTNNNGMTFSTWDTVDHYILNCHSPILQLNSLMWASGQTSGVPTAASLDLGLYYTQYYRDLGSLTAYTSGITKFGNTNTGVYVPTYAYIDITGLSNSQLADSTVSVYGGDTFTQKNYFKSMVPDVDANPSIITGGGVGLAFYSQNRFNFDMRNATFSPYTLNFPDVVSPGVTQNWVNTPNTYNENINYDISYTPRNIENQTDAFDPTVPQVTDYGARTIFSLNKPQGSATNNYRFFPALNFEDISPDNGPITSLLDIDGEVWTLQPGAYLRHFYNERGSLNVGEASSNTEVTLGSGAPFSKPPVQLSSIGCSNIFSVIFGSDVIGNDVVGWIDIIGKNVMLYSKGNLRTISLDRFMRSWFYNNLGFITGDVPVLGGAISGVFDEKTRSFIWTVLNNIQASAYNGSTSYTTGQYVSSGTTFEGFNIIYQALQGSTGQPVNNTAYWRLVPSYYTIVYNLLIDGFMTFLTPMPYFYAKWRNTYLSAYPCTRYNGIYMSDTGAYLTWYPKLGDPIYPNETTQGYLQWVINENNRYDKLFLSISADTLLVPYRYDMNTFAQVSYLTNANSDFKQDRDTFISPVKLDTITSIDGTPYSNGSRLFGQWMQMKLTYDIGVQQSMWATEVKYIPQARRIDT